MPLSAHPKINAIKEASGNISQVAQIAALCGDDLNIYSGNDDQIVPLLALGGKGVLSVAAHVAPQQIHDICQFWFDGKPAESAALQLQLLELCNVLFCDVNPIPVKAAMNLLGYQAGPCRLPLVAPSETNLKKSAPPWKNTACWASKTAVCRGAPRRSPVFFSFKISS